MPPTLLRIVTRVFVTGTDEAHRKENMVEFVKVLANDHNAKVPRQNARFSAEIHARISEENDREWCIRRIEGSQGQSKSQMSFRLFPQLCHIPKHIQ